MSSKKSLNERRNIAIRRYFMQMIYSQVQKIACICKLILKTFLNIAWKYGFIFIMVSYDLFTILI